MKHSPLALAAGLMLLAAGAAAAPRTDIVVGMQLEPPHPRPDRGRGGGDRRGRLCQRLRGADPLRAGRLDPAGAGRELGDRARTGSPGCSTCTTGVTFHDGTPLHRRGRGLLLRPGDGRGFDQRPEAALRRHQRGDRDRRRHRRDRRSTRPRARCSSTSPGATRSSSRRRRADSNATKPVGTGPFKFSQLGAGRPDRAGAGTPTTGATPAKLDKVTFKFISDPTAAFAAMMAGDVDAFPNYPGARRTWRSSRPTRASRCWSARPRARRSSR